MMKSLSKYFLTLTLFALVAPAAQGAISCIKVPQTPVPRLELRQDQETRGLQVALRKYYKAQGNAPLREELGRELLQNLEVYFSKDPNFQNLSPAQLRESSQRVLNSKIVTEAEILSARAAVEIERYRLFLKSHPEKLGRFQWESVMQDLQIPYLIHGTSVENLKAILKYGKITTRIHNSRNNMGGEGQYVYVEIPNRKTQNLRPSLEQAPTGKFSFQDVMTEKGAYLLVSPKIMDLFSLSHINGFWQYGKISPEFSFRTADEILSFLNFLSGNFSSEGYPGDRFSPEMMFHEALDLKKVDFRVVVHASVKETLIAELRSVGVSESVLSRIDTK